MKEYRPISQDALEMFFRRQEVGSSFEKYYEDFEKEHFRNLCDQRQQEDSCTNPVIPFSRVELYLIDPRIVQAWGTPLTEEEILFGKAFGSWLLFFDLALFQKYKTPHLHKIPWNEHQSYVLLKRHMLLSRERAQKRVAVEEASHKKPFTLRLSLIESDIATILEQGPAFKLYKVLQRERLMRNFLIG